MKKLMTLTCCLLALGLMTMTSCKKKDVTTADTDTSSASDNTLAENSSNDVVNIGAQASENASLSSYREANTDNVLSTCAIISRDTVAKTVTVTFTGGTCLDGRVRTGSLTFDYHLSPAGATHYRDPGFTFTVTSNNYVVDGNQITIVNKTVTNTTAPTFNPAQTNLTWSIVATINIVKSNGTTITFTSTRTKTLLNTSDTSVYRGSALPIVWSHAKIQIDGSGSGTRNGENFSSTATAMVRDFNCSVGNHHPWISGTLDYQPPSPKYLRHIDFGSGTCDLDATVTINGTTYNIVLP